MRKGELESLVKGTKIQNKRSEEIVTVEEVKEDSIVASNNKTYKHSTLIRNFDIIVEEPEVNPTVEVITGKNIPQVVEQILTPPATSSIRRLQTKMM